MCWYSIIYTPPEYLGDAFAELARVLKPGGYLLLAFQAGSGEPVLRTDAHGTALSLTSFRHSLSDVTGRLEDAGLEVRATALREPEFDHEMTPQAFVIRAQPVGPYPRRTPTLGARTRGGVRYARTAVRRTSHRGKVAQICAHNRAAEPALGDGRTRHYVRGSSVA